MFGADHRVCDLVPMSIAFPTKMNVSCFTRIEDSCHGFARDSIAHTLKCIADPALVGGGVEYFYRDNSLLTNLKSILQTEALRWGKGKGEMGASGHGSCKDGLDSLLTALTGHISRKISSPETTLGCIGNHTLGLPQHYGSVRLKSVRWHSTALQPFHFSTYLGINQP